MAQYVIGVDFGSLSGRAVLVDSRTGQIAAQRTVPYAHGVMTEGGAGWALHHPADYLDVLETAVPQVQDLIWATWVVQQVPEQEMLLMMS